VSDQTPFNDPDDPLYYAPPWLNERNGHRYTFTAANGNGRDEPAPPAQRRPDQHRSDQTRLDQQRSDQRGPDQYRPKQRGSNQGRASRGQEAPPDIFAEAVARALEQEHEPEFLEVPAALRKDHSLGFAVKSALAVGAAALVAMAYAFYFSASDDNVFAALPTWQSLTSSMFPPPERKEAPALVVQDSSGPLNEPLLLGISVNSPGPGASVTIDRMPSGARLTAGKRMSASEWRVPVELIAETSIIPPADFAGEMNLSATLRSSDGAALVSSFVRLTWGEAAPPQDAVVASNGVVASNDAPIEPSFVLPTDSQRQQAMAAQTMASFGAPTQNASSPPQTAEEPASDLPPGETAYLVKRAQDLMASGDLQAARLLLVRAARTRDIHAALLLAKSFDPNGLRQSRLADPDRDLVQARYWYQKAREWGSPEAQRQLNALVSSR
jgi:hypothetical protein